MEKRQVLASGSVFFEGTRGVGRKTQTGTTFPKTILSEFVASSIPELRRKGRRVTC